MSIINYLLSSFGHALLFLAIVLIPFVFVIAGCQFCSSFLRTRITRVLPHNFFIYATAPGVAVHECGHLFFCLVFLHKVRKVVLFSPSEDGTLGYVSHQYTPGNLYQKIGLFFIGTGPVWFGFLVLFLISRLFLPASIFDPGISETARIRLFFSSFFSLSFWGGFLHWIWFYLAVCIAAHINLSPPDIRGAWLGFVTMIAFVILLFLFFGWIGSFHRSAPGFGALIVRQMSPVFCILFIVSAVSLLIGSVCSLFKRR